MLVFVEGAAQAVVSADVETCDAPRIGDERGQRTRWSGVGDAVRGPVGVVEPFALPESVDQVALVPDQGAVEECAATSLYPALHDPGIRASGHPGIPTPLSTTRIPASASTTSNPPPNSASQPGIMNRAGHLAVLIVNG
jgi:hypothetical protein